MGYRESTVSTILRCVFLRISGKLFAVLLTAELPGRASPLIGKFVGAFDRFGAHRQSEKGHYIHAFYGAFEAVSVDFRLI